ncbi:serine/threonine-protein kinase [Parahaliea aestuarii]|uniref:Protein kinase n=1 Tax=Parahaliea aestuarii TaxID=1852021 RepID=A0A5C8ZPH4_9GAMM|nr:serine/threonine-protein kinase [Parahaliea aestuarii]TXS90373.1 protein kinase [Parahaliea aestuarii]
MTTAAQDILPAIPGYTIQRLLGAGGMARVYLAIQQGFERPVALKIILRELASNPEFGRRFLREARIVGGLSHPHIISVYDVGEHEGFYYLAMELLTSGDLRQRMRSVISEREALEIARQVASALGFAHTRGFIHRDIKPDNVLFRDSGEAVVTDFGIARPAHDSAELTEITQVESVIGSPKYMSPEQSLGQPLDGRSDIYSLGVMLYQMLVGELPFTGRTLAELSLQRLQKQVPRMPPALQHLQPLMDGLLAYDRDERFRDCGAVHAALEQVLPGAGTVNSAPARTGSAADPDAETLVDTVATASAGRTSGSRVAALAVLALVVLVGGGLAWFFAAVPADDIASAYQGASARPESGSTTADQDSLQAANGPLGIPPPEEFFAFYDAVNAGLADLEQDFVKAFPGSVFTQMLQFKLGQAPEAFAALRQRAAAGNSRAQVVVSELYDTGWGVAQDQSQALAHARQAATSGNAFARYHYAMLLLAQAQNDEQRREGLRALQDSADAGFYLAQTVLGTERLEGQLPGRDIDDGLALLAAAGEQGDRNALFNLARILDAGLYGQTADPERARDYFRQAAALGHPGAKSYLEDPL